jgi:DNA modification methylase
MQISLSLTNQSRDKFLKEPLSKFNLPMPQEDLNIDNKVRSNIFTWRGQFSPQLVENLLIAYCPRNATVLDPFVGSGSVLYESASLGLKVFGCEINPAAWILSKVYELANLSFDRRTRLINSVREQLEKYFPKLKSFELQILGERDILMFHEDMCGDLKSIDGLEKKILDAFIILLDFRKNDLTIERIYLIFDRLCNAIADLPYSQSSVITSLCDARNLEFEEETIDFIVTSPPYINVLNYHQHYRHSVEALEWDLLKIAKSEIGSNRANRSNRFLTVIQYCLDMALVLREIQRVCKSNARTILVVGYESRVLGVPFYNSDIISQISTRSGAFELALTQHRSFKNKFGKMIKEDILHLVKKNINLSTSEWNEIARNVALNALTKGFNLVSKDNNLALTQAVERIHKLSHSPLYINQSYDFHKTAYI